jgi:hypothetical protein
MWPYWLLFLTPACWAVFVLRPKQWLTLPTSRDQWPDLWRVMFVFLVLMIGLRHEVGGDWLTYIEHIDTLATGTYAEKFRRQDPAFAFFNELAIQTGLGVYLVNLLSAVFFTWGLLVFCRAQPRPWLALAVAVPYMITVVAMGYTRQGVAIGVAMLGMVALGRGSTLKFVLWIALAAAFHKSAVILIPLAILANTKRRIFTLVWVLASGVALFLLLLQESVDFLIYGYIQSEYQSSGAGIRIAMNAVPAAIFLIFRKRFQLSPEERSFWTWMAWSALLFVVLLKVSPSSTAVDRVALYWIPLQLLVLARLPNALGRSNGKNLVWVCAIVCYSAAVHFVWLMYADTAFAWLPYQFYPWVWFWK